MSHRHTASDQECGAGPPDASLPGARLDGDGYRLNRPYDSVAVRETKEIYLEAKGTQSAGHSIILTRNEVDHARRHPGQCRIGVWSGMRLIDGVVDSEAGTFRVIDLEPNDRDLRPRDYDWTIPTAPQ